MVTEGELLGTPSQERIERAHITTFIRWLAKERGLLFRDFDALWDWSVTDLEGFWQAIWDCYGGISTTPHRAVLESRKMPGTQWFPGAHVNYAEHVLRHERPNATAVLHLSERHPITALSWEALAGKVRILATQFRKLGVQPGDRVVACLPNIPEAMIAMLAATSIGAIWSSCGPDFGTRGVLDRFQQLSPKVLLVVDGYQYGGKPFDRRAEMAQVIAGLPTVERVIYLPYLNRDDQTLPSKNALLWEELFNHPPVPKSEFQYEHVEFYAPLWILFSSGTTGLPKAITHSHGGIILEQMKVLHLMWVLLFGFLLF